MTVAAGFPSENSGIKEKPLLVKFIFPENSKCFLISSFWAFNFSPNRYIKLKVKMVNLKKIELVILNLILGY